MVSNFHIGILLISLSVAFVLVLISFTNELMSMTTCPTEEELGFCPHSGNIPPQTFFGSIIILILIGIGVFLILSPKKVREVKRVSWKKTLKGLGDDEQKIYRTIADSEGVIFQSELIEKTGFSKVKVTRILDKLEAKGILERRRRGMSNIVLLKKS